MTDGCRLEADVLEAAAEDRWTDALRRHVTECEECAAASSVAGWMSRFARIGDREHILPDPSVVWLKAQLLRSNAALDRAARPLNALQLIAYAIVACGWTALLTWKRTALEAWIFSLTPKSMVGEVAAGVAPGLSLTLAAMVVVLSTVTVLLALHTIIAEE